VQRIEVINSGEIAATCSIPIEMTERGFVKTWLILGPFRRPGGAAPGDEYIRYDHLTDGTTTEANVLPAAGASIVPDYGNLAASTGLASTPGRPDVNPGGIPTWFAHTDADNTIDFSEIFGGDTNEVLCYAAAYVEVEKPVEVDLGLSSDDSVQVLVDGNEVHLNNIPRSMDASNFVQDVVPGVILPEGCHLILVKVFEGLGQHGFRLRFQDPAETPLAPGKILLSPCHGEEPVFLRGDSNASGDLNITDGIHVLGYLFTGGAEPPCHDAADSNDSGDLNITDGVHILSYLFTGGATPPDPGPAACGPDPTADELPTCVNDSC
jgi:hypothetical protein